ncbi:MAG TPA: alpha/beta hydrolase [Dehalococcoidia bacterium]|jgi:2-succinyl-6-hydroxy-2,4-cyclohexadiene-1-carboxylate synthase|nr:alpha/beta hydrolase [Dehalococcoidia bacterium]
MPHVTVNGIEIHYRETGEGFPVVLIHGYTGNSRNWALTVPALRGNFRTISVDLRGHGLSAKPASEDGYALEVMASDVYELLGALGIDECVLVGHSMGGMVSQLLVLEHPEIVRALVLVDTAAEVPKGLLYDERLKVRERLVEMAREDGMEAVFEEQLRITPIHSALKANPRYIEIWREQFLMTSREAYIAGAQGMASRRSLRGELGAVKVPTLVICGEKDEPFLEPSRQMYKAISGSELAIIDGAGHGPQMETPAEFNRILSEFLSKVRESAAV